jgi:hypothetical protein
MPVDTPHALPDSRPIYRLVRRTRRLLRSSWVATGLGLTTGLLLCTLVVLLALDVIVPLRPISWTVRGTTVPVDQLIRLGALLLVAVPAVWAFFTGVVRPLCRRLAAVQVARRIESKLPGIHNRLVSCIDLEARKQATASPVFHRRLLSEALERIRGFRARTVLDFLSLRRAAVFAVAGLLSFVLLWALFSARVPRAMARLLMPFSDLPPVGDVSYSVQPGHADVLREEPIGFTVLVDGEGEPASLRLELYNAAGRPPHHFDLQQDRQEPGRWTCTVDGGSLGEGYEDGFRYRVFGGGTWSKEYTVRLVERPVLVGVNTAVYYPRYMGIPEPHPTPPQVAQVTGPEGVKDDPGEVEVVVTAQGDVDRGEIQLLKPAVQAIPRERQTERAWVEDKIPFGAAADGTWEWEKRDRRMVHTEPVDIGTHRHWFEGDPVGHTVNKGDLLFAYVFIPADHPPETIMLQWHDGQGWEHGAYWGADRIHEGKAKSPARRHVGPLPSAGQWVRLEVPAADVGLEEKTLKGMSFILHGGQCYWGRTGTVQVEEPGVAVVKSFPMHRNEDGTWAGRFPLVGKGLFRAELANRQGHPNKPMKELEFVSLPDRPPTVALDRQGTEMVLSKPAAIPLSIAAFDDYGLAEISVHVRSNDKEPYQKRVLKTLETPERSQSLVASLDEAGKLAQGAQVRYLIEARDRKGQTARTREYVVRIAADANAADQQLTQYEKTQDTFRERLIQLMAQQKNVQTQIEKLNKEYAALAEKVAEQVEKRPDPAGKTDPQGKPLPPGPIKLDPETAKRLAELQKQLAQLAQQEAANANAAQQISKDLAQAVEQANKMDLVAKPVADEMRATQQTFQNMVADALQDIGQQMARGADPKLPEAPDLKGLEQKGNRVQKEMEGIKNRLDALANARKGMRDDLREALRQLQRDLLAESGKMTARELEQLRDLLARLREQMKNAQDRQDELMKDAVAGADLPRLKQKQEDLDRQIEKMLANARNLLAARKRDRDRPEFPDSPYTPEGKERTVPPREEDTDEPLPKKGKDDKTGKEKPGDKEKKAEDKDDDDKEQTFMPALNGERLKTDPRFAKKKRPVQRKPKDGKDDPAEREREEMEARQADRAEDLKAAQEALGQDQQTLEQLMQQLQQSLQAQGKANKGQPNDNPSEADQMAEQLRQMMQSPAMQAAMAMASRARQGPPRRPQPGQPQQPSPSQSARGNMDGSMQNARRDAELAKLDPDTRATLLKLPPRLRDELIQGMNEQGPEAYRAFIQDYFKRLTETKPAGK